MKVLVELRDPDVFRQVMESQGMSVRGLAAAADVSPAFISHFRSKVRHRRASVQVAARIAAALDVEPETLWAVPTAFDPFGKPL